MSVSLLLPHTSLSAPLVVIKPSPELLLCLCQSYSMPESRSQRLLTSVSCSRPGLLLTSPNGNRVAETTLASIPKQLVALLVCLLLRMFSTDLISHLKTAQNKTEYLLLPKTKGRKLTGCLVYSKWERFWPVNLYQLSKLLQTCRSNCQLVLSFW